MQKYFLEPTARLFSGSHVSFVSINSERFNQATILHTRRTRGFTTSAIKTKVEMPLYGVCQIDATIND
jgi:hypothetical protein